MKENIFKRQHNQSNRSILIVYRKSVFFQMGFCVVY